MTICSMRIACWMPKAANTHSQYVILIAFPLQKRSPESASMLHHTYSTLLVFLKVKWEIRKIRKRKANWIGYILRRNCLLQQVIEGKIKGQIEVTRRQGRRRKRLLDDLKDRRGYCQLKEEALDRTMCRNRFGRGLDLSFHRLLMMMMKWIYASLFLDAGS